MGLKLLVAAFCLLAVVQARPPKPPTSSCSVSCVSRTFWTGYQAGSVYTYEFEQNVELSSDLSARQKSRLHVSGLARVEVHSDCEMALTVEVQQAKVGSDVDADAMSPREPPAKVMAGLRAPLRFAFDNGRVAQLCPSAEETRASLNLKRGLLSQLQVSTEQRGQAHQLEERDVLGDCWTEYTPEGANTLLKTKDLARCKKLNYQAYPLLGVKSFEDERDQQQITKGSLTCRIEVDPERDIVKSTRCQEEQSPSQDSSESQEKISTTTRLTLKNEESGLASALQEVSQRTDLRHAHKTTKQCQSASAWLQEDFFHSGNECVERKHGAESSTQYKAKAQKTLEDLCNATKSEKMTRDTPKKYADLIKYLRGITEQEHLDQIYQWVRNGFCSENTLMRTIMRSAIPSVGTKQSVALMLSELSKSNEEEAVRKNWLINGIAFMEHPTPEILPEFLNYVRNARDQALLGINRDEPLALSAVVHRICQDQPNCESDPRVKAVVDYFSQSLGSNCEQLSTDADVAFAALLSVGNMGRVNGGASALVRCAFNQRLSTIHRAFALHSLRRFANISTEAQEQLIQLLLNTEQDSEIRIVAYQSLARQGFKKSMRLQEAVQQLLDKTEDDRQVQMFAYTHLQTLKGSDARVMAPVLRNAKTGAELRKLSRRQYSSVLKGQYYSPSMKAGAQAEVPIVFSSESAIPRYIGLNLTVNLPGEGQSFNMMELGVRMQGLEKLVEDVYSRIAKKFNSGSESTDRSESGSSDEQPELTEEQKRLSKAAPEPRIDVLIRKYGAELSHTDLSGGILESLATGAANPGQFLPFLSTVRPVAGEAPGASAGTLMEQTISIPTVAGLPILVKKEAHYITRLGTEMNVDRDSQEVALQLKPAAAVQMSRTVAVDAIFERAGIRSSTSFLTSTGLKVSMKNTLSSSTDKQFAVKVEPLMKKQSVADVKTEVKFFQHNAGKQLIEKPLAPQESSIKREKCFEGLAKSLSGHKICYELESLPSCENWLNQCPSAYQLYLEKNEDFGAYELSFKLKKQNNIKQLQLLVGDKKSQDRLLKFNIQSVRQGSLTNYKFELQNPIFPIVLDSNFTRASDGHQMSSKAQVGSVQYVATGSVKPDSEKGVVIKTEFYPKERPAQKVQLTMEHKFDGFTPILLPQATTKAKMVMHTGNELKLDYQLKWEAANFFWQMSSQYKTQKGESTSARYRVQYRKTNSATVGTSTVFLYDIETQNPRGNNLVHSLHAKLMRGAQADSKTIGVTVNHKLQYGVDKKTSPLDFDARINLQETKQAEQVKITGDGEIKYIKSGKAVTAKVAKVKIQLGKDSNTTEGFGQQYVYAVSYQIQVESKKADYQVEVRHMPWRQWSLSKQAVELKAIAQFEGKSYKAILKHALNAAELQSRQVAKLQYDDDVYFHIDHKLQKVRSTSAIRHELLLQGSRNNKLQTKCGITWPAEGVMNADLIVETNNEKVFGCQHSMSYISLPQDQQVKHKTTLETRSSVYSLETDAEISRQSLEDAARYFGHLARLATGKSYRSDRILQLLFRMVKNLKLKHKSQLTGPTSSEKVVMENVIDMDATEGVMWQNLFKITANSKDTKYGITITKSREADTDSKLDKGMKLKVNFGENSLQTEAKLSVDKTTNAKGTVKVSSNDTWGWHDVKLDISTKITPQSQKSEQKALIKLEGEINNVSIKSSMNITVGTDNRNQQNYLIIEVAGPESKLYVKLLKSMSSLKQMTSILNLDGDFGMLPYKSMKAKTEFDFLTAFAFESDAEIESKQIYSTKVRIENNNIVIDLKTGHRFLEEAGVKIALETDVADTIKWNGIAKFTGLAKKMQVKKMGSATLNRNSPVYSFLLGLTEKMELEGFESILSYKKLEYELMLKKKPGMEFQFDVSVSAPESAKSQLVYITSTLNYWPFKAEMKVKADNQKGWEVKYGARAELDYKNAFIGIEYNDKEAAASYNIQDGQSNTKTANFRVKCTFCANSNRDLVSGQANMTWPLSASEFELGMDMQIDSRQLQKIILRIVHRPAKKQILAAFRWNGATQKLIDCAYNQASAPGGGVRGSALLHSDLRFFLGEQARAKVQVNYDWSTDKELNFSLTLAESNEELYKGKFFLLSAPRSYDSIPVAGVDAGVQLKGPGANAYIVRVSKTGQNSEWHVSIRMPGLEEPITGRIEREAGKVKSGKINAFGREITVSSTPEGDIEMSLKSGSDETKTIRAKWTGKYESLQDMRAKLEIEANSEVSIAEIVGQPKQIIIKYGKSAGPNSLKVDYEMRETMTDLSITHETDEEKNSELTILPGYTIQIPTTNYPFKISAKIESRKLTVSLEGTSMGVKSMIYGHDFTNFPQSMSAESNLISASDNKIWDMKVNMDFDIPTAVAECQIGDKFKLSFKEPSFELKIQNVLDMAIQFPRFLSSSDDSDKKELEVKLALPALQVTEPINLKITMEKLTEGRQLKVQYGRGEEADHIVWYLTARKYRTTPKFDIDVEASLTSKYPLLGDWQIRSLEARLESSNEANSDAYTIIFKDSIKLNGEDLAAIIARLDGKRNALPTKAEVTINGKMEANLKLDLSEEDKPAKLSIALEKIGENRQKYAMKLSAGPTKTDAYYPDFKLETECPHRHFVLSKEFKKEGVEKLVSVEFYLNKRQSHGATIIYKTEAAESSAPKYTLEVALPTRKIRAVCQPEKADKKISVKTTFDWDADKSLDKVVELNTNIDYSTDVEAEIECKAPFLSNPVKLEGRYKSKRNGYILKLKHKSGDSEALKAKVEYNYERLAQHNSARLALETRGSVNVKFSLAARASEDSENPGRRKFEGELSLNASSMERNIKFRYRPMSEITVSCNRGASLSLRYSNTEEDQMRQLQVFVSDNEKSASRLKLVFSAPQQKLTAKLDTGRGSFDHSGDLRLPNYRPEKVLMRAVLGKNNEGIECSVFLGEMTVGQKPSLMQPSSVPSHLSFASFIYQRAEKSKVNYKINWRLPEQDKTEATVESLKQALNNYKISIVPDMASAAESLKTLSANIVFDLNAAWIAEEIRSLASNDLDQLARYIERTLADNEFFLGSIAGAAQSAIRAAKEYLQAVANAITSLKEMLDQLQISDKVSELIQQAWNAAAGLYSSISLQGILDTIVEFAERVKDLLNTLCDKVVEKASEFLDWLAGLLRNSSGDHFLFPVLMQIGEYLDRLSPLTSSANEFLQQVWWQARSMLAASIAGMKSLVVDDLLPLAMNHVEDAQTFVNLYNNVVLELRVWYDSGATPAEREALSQTTQLLNYFFSEESLNAVTRLAEAAQLCLNGEFTDAINLFGSPSDRVSVWRPACDNACQRSETPFAAIEGSLDAGDFMPEWQSARSVSIVAQRIGYKLIRGGLSESANLAYALIAPIMGNWDPILRLLTVRHRTAVLASDNHLITFDGVALTHQRPCSYLVAHDFQKGDFSVVQEYRKESGRQVRGPLRIRFGKLRVSVDHNGDEVKVNGRIENEPMRKSVEGKSVETSRKGDLLTVRFSGKLADTLVLRCKLNSYSCLVSVHPLYQGRVLGLAGSNDGRRDNDIRRGGAREHAKFWTAGQCEADDTEDSSQSPSASVAELDKSNTDGDCYAWFRRSDSPMAACFQKVDPTPFESICQRKADDIMATCRAAHQYAVRCRVEAVRVRSPNQCGYSSP